MDYYDYLLECREGGYFPCGNRVEVAIPIVGLTEEQIDDLRERGMTYVTKAQVEESAYPVTKEQREDLERTGEMVFEYSLGFICCAECGSDRD